MTPDEKTGNWRSEVANALITSTKRGENWLDFLVTCSKTAIRSTEVGIKSSKRW